MRYSYKLCFCCVLLVVLYEAALADKEDKSDEASSSTDRNKTRINQTRRVETAQGPPDSHEAMNNREMINPIRGEKMRRNKRSYEFLMGLINNNSRYEVTRKEPTDDDLDVMGMKNRANPEPNVGASELLLELVVKIAENPEQWSRVHKLLRQLDQDILTSKQLIDDFKNHTSEMQNQVQEEDLQLINKKQENSNEKLRDEDKKKKKYEQAEINKEVAMTSDNGQPDINTSLFGDTIEPTVTTSSSTKEWPTFSYQENNVKFVKDIADVDSLSDKNVEKHPDTSSSTNRAYPKYFSYHIVTGKPIFINKNPKAYVAVSVVAPKAANVRSDEDLELEHELRQLKPWTHSQNLKNMESIRSRWLIDSEKYEEKSET